ncbi:3-dehydroquinate synthase [Thermaurantiacus sp.]
MIRIPVELGTRRYEVAVGPGLLQTVGETVARLTRAQRIPVVTDETVARLHLATVAQALTAAGREAVPIVVPAGEAAKSFPVLETLVGKLVEAGVARDGLVVALGGGVIGDLTGFAAAILNRGVPYLQLPTTLLAMVDSSVGGKTAINLPAGKNLVGAFHHPAGVIADTGVLATLPDRELRAGYAEVVKYGLLGDADFFAWCEAEGAGVLAREPSALVHVVSASVRAKAAVVAADAEERGDIRALLNLGHTFGHALEAEAGFGEALLHGEAVAVGMAQAFRFSARLGLAPAEDGARVERHLAAVGLPTRRPYPAARLLRHMAHDKKRTASGLAFVLVRGIGKAFVARDVPVAEVRAFLEAEAAGS